MQCKKLTEIKKDLMKNIKNEENVSVRVMVFECNDGADFDVEINFYFDGDYVDGFVPDYFNKEDDAMKRAKAVLKSVKKWFEYSDVTVDNEIELYHE